MTGLEAQLMGRVVGEAAKPLLRNMKRALARRGFGKTEFYDEFETMNDQLGEVSTLGLLSALPAGMTDADVSKLISSPSMLQLARVRLAAELADDEMARSSANADIRGLFFGAFPTIDSDELDLYVQKYLGQMASHCTGIKERLSERLNTKREALTWAYEQIANSYIWSIRTNKRADRAAQSVNAREIQEWTRRYKVVFDSFHRNIEIPDLLNRRKVDYTKLFVGNWLVPVSRESELLAESHGGAVVSDESALSILDRAVLLGDPGAGKSTTSNVLAIRAWTDLDVVPIIVVMKDVRGLAQGFSVVRHIENLMQSKYQCQPEPGLIERLLLDGKAFVVFDGLDELLNGAHRRTAAAVIEAFGRSYPLTRIIVTSRRTGYSIARLDPEIFDEFQLDSFDVNQVEAYVSKWLSLQQTTDEDEIKEQVADFMRTSESIEDLRANPLLLAFICVLYNGHRSIPRRRTKLYQKCVELLLGEWDKARGISEEEADIDLYEVVLTRVAYLTAIEREGFHGELTEDKVYEVGVPALLKEEVPTEREARNIVCDVLRLCRGRAWIFTDVGLDADGNDLFGFTHASFVEYFAAKHIHRSKASPEEMADELIPRVAAGQWEVLAQMCLSMGRSGKVAGGSRAVIRMLDHVDAVLAGKLANRRGRALKFSTAARSHEKSYQADGDVAIVDFLLRASDALPISSDVLSRLVELSLSQLAEGRSRTLGVILEKRYKHQVEASNRVSAILNDGVRCAIDRGSSHELALAWLVAHFPYMSKYPASFRASDEAVRTLHSRLHVPSGDWDAVASRSLLWWQVSMHLGKASVIEAGKVGEDTTAGAYRSLYIPLNQPILDFGPTSTAMWILDCLASRDVVAINSHRAVRVLRLLGEGLLRLPIEVGEPTGLTISKRDLMTLQKISKRLHGYGKSVIVGWLYMCMGLLELVSLIEGVSCGVVVEEVGMDVVFDSYRQSGVLSSAEYWEWLGRYERIWVVENDQAVS